MRVVSSLTGLPFFRYRGEKKGRFLWPRPRDPRRHVPCERGFFLRFFLLPVFCPPRLPLSSAGVRKKTTLLFPTLRRAVRLRLYGSPRKPVFLKRMAST